MYQVLIYMYKCALLGAAWNEVSILENEQSCHQRTPTFFACEQSAPLNTASDLNLDWLFGIHRCGNYAAYYSRRMLQLLCAVCTRINVIK